MNAYLFGCLVLGVLWLAALGILWKRRQEHNLREFLWASFTCCLLGATEPLFVPEYWDPPSILKIRDWDLESFLFCFAVGGLAAVLTEIPGVRGALLWLDYVVWRVVRATFLVLVRLTRGSLQIGETSVASCSMLVPRDRVRVENMILVAFFFAVFGATSHFGLNIIYDVAFVSVATAVFIWWRRPKLRWQILGGGLSFTVIYTVVLIVVGLVYPDFYDHWNHKELSGVWLAGAPIEEYLFAFTFGMFWAPLYEAWKDERTA